MIRISLIQSQVGNSVKETLKSIDNLINKQIQQEKEKKEKDETYTCTSLFILPDCFATGLALTQQEIEESSEVILSWMKDTAKTNGKALMGSLLIKENDKYYDRMYFINEQSEIIQTYDKTHFFIGDSVINEQPTSDKETSESIRKYYAHENYFTKGTNKVIVQHKGTNFLMTLTTDLKYPGFLRNEPMDYDIIVCSACFVKEWTMSMKYIISGRACENLGLCCIVNPIGVDKKNNVEFSGNTMACDYFAAQIQQEDVNDNGSVFSFVFDKARKDRIVKKFDIYKDFDTFTLNKPYNVIKP